MIPRPAMTCVTTSGPYRCTASGEPHAECECTAPEYAIGKGAGVVLGVVERHAAHLALGRVRIMALRAAGVLESQIVADCEILARAIGGAAP